MRESGHAASLDAGRIPDAFIDWRVTLGRETDSMRNERDMVRAIVSGSTFRPGLTFQDDELAAIQHETLFVSGTNDPVGTVDTWKRVVGLLPRGELRLVDGGGHVPWLDDPVEIAADVSRFLAAEASTPDASASSLDNEPYTHFIPISPDFQRLSAHLIWLVQAKSA